MYYIGKVIGSLVSPVGITLIGLALYFVLVSIGGGNRCGSVWGRIGRFVGILTLCWLWFFSTSLVSRVVGFGLEREFLVADKIPNVDSYPNADAILLLGGSMGYNTNICDTAEMWSSADRVWNAARLFNAGKADKIIVTGGGVEASTKTLLLDFGVPANAIIFDESPRNTEEEVRAATVRGDRKVLVVTSAWHMKRAMLLFRKYAPNVEAVPAPTDFENTMASARAISFWDFIPNPAALSANSIAFHEWLGILACSVLR